ncbi:MAG TPA: site-2 protease family protein [Candidatus Paceibacterota bacterium]|nr:site-2 protease family protein [Candidatus Paceibacterota bacterium]
MEINLFFSLAILVISIVVHEVSHGYAAYFLGDPTAKYAGRLTLNPFPHVDLLGSIIVPVILALLPGSIIFGWAKPVPVNTYNLRHGKWGEAIVAVAGPISNLVIAAVSALFIRLSVAGTLPLAEASVSLLAGIALVNIVLAVFNLMPIPPLDGSKILYALLPARFSGVRNVLERHGFLFVILFIFIIWSPIAEIVIPWLYNMLTGLAF